MRHKWTYQDKSLAVLLYREDITSISAILKWCAQNGIDLAKRGISPDSLYLEIESVRFLDTGKGFDAASSLLEDAYRDHRFTSLEELRGIAMKYANTRDFP